MRPAGNTTGAPAQAAPFPEVPPQVRQVGAEGLGAGELVPQAAEVTTWGM